MANGTWKIARGKGSPQLSIAIVAVLAALLVVLGRAQSSLFDRARTYFSDATAPMLVAVKGPVNAIGHWIGGLDEIFVVYQQNQDLKRENARLRQWQNAALVLEQRLKRYQLLLNAVPDPSLSAVTAHVIGRANRPFLDTMILDAGRNEGIKPGEAVVDARGMIGRIYLVGQHTSWVILLTDLSSRIPVAVEPGHIQAILAGDNTSAPGLDLSKQGIVLKEGQQIVTSGDGGLLPAGLPVGTVYWDGSEFRAGLLADAASADDVRILDLKAPPEQPPTPAPGDLPVTAAGLQPLAPAPTSPNAQVQRPPLQIPGMPPPKPATTTASTPAPDQPEEQDH
ncbi:MAG TPA: rod shape-determining protein MreC [Rhizomicrobium sp.]|nr:rod shape-determining protein MreC [Rhizomicrobium sp.]